MPSENCNTGYYAKSCGKTILFAQKTETFLQESCCPLKTVNKTCIAIAYKENCPPSRSTCKLSTYHFRLACYQLCLRNNTIIAYRLFIKIFIPAANNLFLPGNVCSVEVIIWITYLLCKCFDFPTPIRNGNV